MVSELSVIGAFKAAAWLIELIIGPVLVTAGVTVGAVVLQWLVQQAKAFRL